MVTENAMFLGRLSKCGTSQKTCLFIGFATFGIKSNEQKTILS